MSDLPFWLVIVSILFGFYISAAIKRLRENKYLVIFRNNKPIRVGGPGNVIVLPLFQSSKIVDKKIQSLSLPDVRLPVHSKCSGVTGSFKFQIFDPLKAAAIGSVAGEIKQAVQAILLSVLSNATLRQCQSETWILENLALELINAKTKGWGVKLTQLEFTSFPLYRLLL